MELVIRNTTGIAPYGIDEIIHSEPVGTLNKATQVYDQWCMDNLRPGDKLPQGRVIDGDDEYDAASGEYIDD